MKRRLILLVIISITISGFVFMPTASAIYFEEKSCWETKETTGWAPLDSRISKVEAAGHVVFDDTDPTGFCRYGIWLYGRWTASGGAIYYTTIKVKMYVQAYYHIKEYDGGHPISNYYKWDYAPSGLIYHSRDYEYGPGVPGTWTWTAQIGAGNDAFGMRLGTSFTPNPVDSDAAANQISSNWRYMGYVKSHYSTPWGAEQTCIFLVKLHVDNSMAEDYYDGIYVQDGRYRSYTWIEAFRFKLVYEYRWGVSQVRRATHTHVMGDGTPSPDDSSIPLVPGSAL